MGSHAVLNKGAEWHEQLNSFLMKQQLLTEPSSNTLSNSAVTVHHLARLYIDVIQRLVDQVVHDPETSAEIILSLAWAAVSNICLPG